MKIRLMALLVCGLTASIALAGTATEEEPKTTGYC